ncbi:hypothetical protein [Corynebacterium halotolerans]|uniref:Secreted protein n=1 Tax=Corynebacterium halotolerans YIM 70093 = DSM 44683 TaxID=1121362 RepID=M1MTN5_9CORY|nr:hypothetical protein [Corynebacterium halotolerans]AGF71049.1 hypothetical protein A605_00155 [Corynebacterium halotolerans YIM 70093 = DSM 44683]
MNLLSRRSVRTGIVTAASAVLLATALPATASADIVDDMLAKLPSGQITCEQAGKYWTSEAEYDKTASQARLAATFHSRGDEIRAALARVEEAADRCGLKGGGQAPVEMPAEPEPSQPAPSPQNPDTPASNENDRDDEDDQDTEPPTPTPGEDATPDNNDTETIQDDQGWDHDDYEVPALGSSDIPLLLGLLMGSGSSR